MNKTLGITVVAGIVTLVVVIWLYGGARFNQGKAEAQTACNTAISKAAVQSSKELERIRRETKNMSDPDIDAGLSRLGIMRDDTDR